MRRASSRFSGSVPTGWLLAGGLLLAFMVGPLLALAAELPRVARSDFLDVPGGIRPATGAALWVSLRTATVAVAIVAVLGVPLGVWLARTRSRWRHAVTVAVLVPLALPPVVAGLVLLMFVGRAGTLGPLLSHFGISVGETLLGSTLAQMYVAAPFVVIATRAAVADVAPEMEDAARTLGCGPGRALTRVLLPAARRGLVLGLVLGWVRVLGEYGATAIVANYPFTLPVLTYANLQSGGIDPAIPPAVVLVVVATGVAGIVLWLTVDRTSSAPAATGVPEVAQRLAYERADTPRRTATSSSEGLSVHVGLVEGDFDLDVAFEAPPGVTAILGPSGAGKSLTLKAIAGLLTLERGHVRLGGEHLADVARGIDLPPERRRMGYVSQRDSLFGHMSVAGNVGFGLWRLPRAERERRVAEVLGAFAVGPGLDGRTPTLSGGERQRVALARALAPGPDVLLLDEPFAALDAALRQRARRLVSALSADRGLPVVLVTHDRDDVEDLADHVVVMGRGRVLQSGPTVEVFSRPATTEVAALVGMANLVTVHTLGARDGRVNVTTDWGEVSVEAPTGDLTGPGWALAVPADAVDLVPGNASAGLAVGRVLAVRARVNGCAVRVEHPGGETLDVMARIPGDAEPILPGTDCGVRLNGSRTVLVRTAGPPGPLSRKWQPEAGTDHRA